MTQVHYGHVFHVAGRPTVDGAAAALAEIPDGAVVIDDHGRIMFCGNRSDVPGEFSSAVVHDHRPGFLLPGFVDTHVHFPQTYAGDSYGGGQLLEWLNQCIFPSESRFANPEFAARAAIEFCNRRIAAGTTAAMVFGSAFPHAQDALFTETQRRGLRIVSGRGIQTVGPDTAAPLLTSEADAIRLAREEIDKWHAADTGVVDTALLHVAIVPRFALSVTKRAYQVGSYLDTYDGRFLPGSAVGGAISQLFLGSGTMPWKRTVASGVNIAAGTDFGGGDEWLIPRVLGDAFKVHITEAARLESRCTRRMLFMGTLAGARALDMEDRFGNFDVGKEADFVVIDPAGTPALEANVTQAVRSADPDLARDQTLFALLMGIRESSISEVYVQGRRVTTG